MAVVSDAKREPDRLAIARHLAEHGPTAGDVLTERMGMTPERFWVLINCPWFEITGTGWELTADGRRESERAT